MYELHYKSKFKKNIKKYTNKQADIDIINDVIGKLLLGEKLPERYRDHQLTGSLKIYRECHIKPDLLLVYRYEDEFLILSDIGTRSSLF